MKKFSLQWVPHELTIAQKRPRVADSQKLLQTLIADAPNEFINLTSAHESWYCRFDHHSPQWRTSRDLLPTQTLQKIDSKKSIFTLILSGNGLLALDKLPKGCSMNGQDFCDVVLDDAQSSMVKDETDNEGQESGQEIKGNRIDTGFQWTDDSESLSQHAALVTTHSLTDSGRSRSDLVSVLWKGFQLLNIWKDPSSAKLIRDVRSQICTGRKGATSPMLPSHG
jgi:hypothetical protein